MKKKLGLLAAEFKSEFAPYRTAALSIAIAITAIVIVSVISGVGSSLIDTELSGLGLDGVALSVAEKTDRNQMTAALYQQLKEVSGVKDSTPIVMDSGAYELGAKTGNAFFWGIAPKAENIVTLELLHGQMIGSEEVLGARKVCIVDEKIARDAYQRTNIVGKTIRLTINGVTDGYTVIGVVKAGSSLLNGLTGNVMPNFIYLPYSTLSFFSAKEGFDQILFTARQPDGLDEVKEEITAALRGITQGGETDFVLNDLAAQRDSIDRIVLVASGALALIAGISLVVGGLAVSSSVGTAVHTRRREIGIKKSLGAPPSVIVKEFLAQILFTSLGAALTGTLFSGLGCWLLLTVFGLPLLLDLPLLLGGIFATIGLSILFGVFPALRAAKMKPVDALRGE